jgi:hypothetical protein
MFLGPILYMVLDKPLMDEIDRKLGNQFYWNVIIAPDGTDKSYPQYAKIASAVGCREEDIKEYKDMVFGSRTPGV